MILLLFLLPALVTRGGETWPTYHGGENLRGVSAQTLPDKPVLRWRFQAGAPVYNTPVFDGTQIYFSDTRGTVYALDLQGKEVWRRRFTRTMRYSGRETSQRFDAPLAVFEGLLFAGAARGPLYALKTSNGDTVWQAEIGGVLTGSANRVPGVEGQGSLVVVIEQSFGSLLAFDLATGAARWKAKGEERCDGSAGVEGAWLAFGSCLSAVHVYRARDGRHLHNIPLPLEAEAAGGTALADGFAYLGTRLGGLVCADLKTGTVRWNYQAPEAEAFATPAVGRDLVVFSVDNAHVYGLEREKGTLRWHFKTQGMPTSPVLVGDTVAVTASGYLYLLKARDGTLLWSRELSDDITSPAVIDGMLVMGADDGTVSAFGKQPE